MTARPVTPPSSRPHSFIEGCPCQLCLKIDFKQQHGDTPRITVPMHPLNLFIVCPTCGNKRCPHATDHTYACTGSNEPGQKGSSWENYPVPPSGPEIISREELRELIASGNVSGAKPKRRHVEASNQESLFEFLAIHERRYEALRFVHASINGIGLYGFQAVQAKRSGMKRGIWDVLAPVPSPLYVELKTDDGKLTPEQKAFRAQLEPHGYRFEVARSWHRAAAIIGQHVGIPESDTAFWSALADRADREKGARL